MKRLLLVLLAALIVIPSLRAESAEEMASNCKSIAAAKISEGQVGIPQDFGSGVCWGAFASLQKAITLARDGIRVLGACVPTDASRTQLIQVFLEYSRRHPEQLDQDFFIVAVRAAQQSFPCSQ
jgi:hypothetical protein